MSTKKIKLKTRKQLAQLNEALKADMRQHEIAILEKERGWARQHAQITAEYLSALHRADELQRQIDHIRHMAPNLSTILYNAAADLRNNGL